MQRSIQALLGMMLGMTAWTGIIVLTACAGTDGVSETGFTYKDLPIATGSASAGEGNTVTFRDSPLALAGPGIKVGDSLRGLDKAVELITVSVDTPFAQSRFAKEAKIHNVTFLSDYRGGEFGRAHGLLVREPHFLARSVMVVDKDNVIRYLQVTPELGQLPDMEAAFRFARSLATKS